MLPSKSSAVAASRGRRPAVPLNIARLALLSAVVAVCLPGAAAQCYLMDANAKCANCWVTKNANTDKASTNLAE